VFIKFFYALREEGLPVSLHEYLSLCEVLNSKPEGFPVREFYALSKSVLIKSEHYIYRFNKIFEEFFQPLTTVNINDLFGQIPEEWLDKLKKDLGRELDLSKIEKFGGLDGLLERLKQLLEEQDEEHHGGNKWIGTGGTSPFGHGGQHPEGLHLGPRKNSNRTGIGGRNGAQYKDLDGDTELNTRNIKVALKQLRQWIREGPETELDLDQTIKRTSQNAGRIDLAMRANKKNRIKVLVLMDIGGSMDHHIHTCERLFSAMKHEFKRLEYFYFHNCPYERLWKSNIRRYNGAISTHELLRKYNRDYKVIFVGDAAMSPYELFYKGGSVEHYNEEPGMHWLNTLSSQYSNLIWLNPNPEMEWEFYETTSIIRNFTRNRMFPLTLEGLKLGMKCLKQPNRTYTKSVWGSR